MISSGIDRFIYETKADSVKNTKKEPFRKTSVLKKTGMAIRPGLGPDFFSTRPKNFFVS